MSLDRQAHSLTNISKNKSSKQDAVGLQYFDYSEETGPEGGHWNRVADNAEKISDLGFDFVWVQPPTEPVGEDSNGYDPFNHLNWNSALGTEEEFDKMLEEAHSQGLEIHIDAILNHMGMEHPEDAEYPHMDGEEYFNPRDASSRTEQHLFGLWDLDQSHGDVSDYLHNFIMKAEEKEVDGYRWDAAMHIPEWFFEHLAEEWVSEDSFTVGEVFDSDLDMITDYTSTGMNCYDFPLFFSLHDSFRREGSMETVAAALDPGNFAEDSLTAYHPDDSVTFVENHDEGPPEYDKLAYALVLTSPGIPLVYANNSKDEGVDLEADWLQDYVEARKRTDGGPIHFHQTENPEDVLVYERDNLIGAINKSSYPYEQEIEPELYHDDRLEEITAEGKLYLENNGQITVRVDPEDATLLTGMNQSER